jgi:hypothetical protein
VGRSSQPLRAGLTFVAPAALRGSERSPYAEDGAPGHPCLPQGYGGQDLTWGNRRAEPWGTRGLPTHLTHPLQDERAVVIHVIGPPSEGQRQNRGESSGLLPVDIAG